MILNLFQDFEKKWYFLGKHSIKAECGGGVWAFSYDFSFLDYSFVNFLYP